MHSKPRADAKLLNLPEKSIEKIRAALLAGMNYSDACQFILREFGIAVGRSTVCAFWKLNCSPFLHAPRAAIGRESGGFDSEPGQKPVRPDQVAPGVFQMRASNLALNPDTSPGELSALWNLDLK